MTNWVIHDTGLLHVYFKGVDPERSDYQFCRWGPDIDKAIHFGTKEAAEYIRRKVGGYLVNDNA